MGFSLDIFSWPFACVIRLPLAIINDTSIQRFPQYEDFILAKGYCRRLVSRYGFSRARVTANLKVKIADAPREGRGRSGRRRARWKPIIMLAKEPHAQYNMRSDEHLTLFPIYLSLFVVSILCRR